MRAICYTVLMTFGKYLFLIILAALVAVGTWGLVLWRIDPFETGFFGIALFYLTFFIALFGVSLVILTVYRVYLRKHPFVFRETIISCRHAVLLSVYATALLALVSQQMLHWWMFLVLSFVILACESFALLMDHTRERSSST